MFKKENVLWLIVVGIFFLTGCAATAPTPGKGLKTTDFQEQGSVSAFRAAYGMIAYPQVSPDGRRVVSTSTSGDLFVSDLAGTNEVMIYNKAEDQNFKTTYQNEDVDISNNPYARKYVVFLTASSFLKKWAEGVREITDISWSPDSTRVAVNVSTGMANFSTIYVIDVNTGHKTLVRMYQTPETGNARLHNGVTWKGNDRLVYSYFAEDNFLLMERNLTDQTELELSRNAIIRAYFSPDGGSVAYVKVPETARRRFLNDHTGERIFETWVADHNFANAKRLLAGQKFTNKEMAWSVDSEKLYYVEEAGVIHNILYEYEIKSGSQRKICEGDLMTGPVITTDNDLYFNINNHIFAFKAL